jgi:hypothetical protein
MPTQEYASIILLSLDSPTLGRVALKDAVTFDKTTTQAKTPVNTMNARRTARGYRTSTKAVTWTLTTPVRKGDPEVDWEAIRDSNEEFNLRYERDDNGKARQLLDCVVNEVQEQASEDGTMTMTVSGMALDDVSA